MGPNAAASVDVDISRAITLEAWMSPSSAPAGGAGGAQSCKSEVLWSEQVYQKFTMSHCDMQHLIRSFTIARVAYVNYQCYVMVMSF